MKLTVRRVREIARAHRSDLLLTSLALLFASVTLFYPYGRDQGLYHYVGREWLRGVLPYRDAMDQKTPVIYLIFGLANAVFGEHLWSIRVVELAWVLGVGWALGALAAPRGEDPAPGVRGTAALSLVLLYFGTLNYWDTAQCEVWYAGMTFMSLHAVERRAQPTRAAHVGGVWAGLACLAKPPAVFMLLVVVAALATRLLAEPGTGARRVVHTIKGLALYGLGAAAPTLLTLAYFAANDGLAALYDVLVLCNAYYREHEVTATPWGKAVAQLGDHFWPLLYPIGLYAALAIAIGLAVAVRRRAWALGRRYLMALVFPLAAFLGVYVQQMFFPYHWGAPLLAVGPALAYAAHDLSRHGPTFVTRPVSGAWFAGALAALLAIGFSASGPTAHIYRANVARTLEYARGRISDEEFAQHFVLPNFYDWPANVAISKWLLANSKPEDEVAVRAFEPAIYALAHRRTQLRFFWTPWIAYANRAYRREEWLAEDTAQLRAHPPRFAISVQHLTEGPESPQYLEQAGHWVPRMNAGVFVVLERVTP